MKRTLVAGVCALALLAGCTATQVQKVNAALAAAEAVNADLVSLKADVQASGTTITPAELAALNDAIAQADAGVRSLGSGTASVASVLEKIQAKLLVLEPFIPAVAQIIAALASPAPVALTAPAPMSPALNKLASDLMILRAAR